MLKRTVLLTLLAFISSCSNIKSKKPKDDKADTAGIVVDVIDVEDECAPYSLNIDSAVQYAVFPSLSASNFTEGEFTIEVWVKPDDHLGLEGKVSTVVGDLDHDEYTDDGAGDGWTLWSNPSSGGFGFSQSNGGDSLETGNFSLMAIYPDPDKWTHIAVTRQLIDPVEGSYYWRLFYNGLKVQEVISSYEPTSGEGITIGLTRPGDILFNWGWEGNISQVRISNIVNYPDGNSFAPSVNLTDNLNTVALWSLNQSEGDSISGAGVYGTDGVVYNPNWDNKHPSCEG